MVPKTVATTIGSLVLKSGFDKALQTDVAEVAKRSGSRSTRLTGSYLTRPDGELVTLAIDVNSCGRNANATAAALGDFTQKWNEYFKDWGLPLRISAQTGEDSMPGSVDLGSFACTTGPLPVESTIGIPELLGLKCPEITPDIEPALHRALSNDIGQFGFTNYPAGEWRPAACGMPYLPGPTDVVALAQMSGADSEVHVKKVTDELVERLSAKYGNNIIGHFLGALSGDITRRVVELLLVRGGDFKDRQWIVKIVGETVSVAVQVAVMAHFGGYTAIGGAVSAGMGLAGGILGELVLPEFIRSLVVTLGPINLGLAITDAAFGTGNWPSELIGSYVGHFVAQLALGAAEAVLEKFLPERDEAKREMLSQGGFSVWDSCDSTFIREPFAPWNLGHHLPACVQTLHYGNKLLADFVQKYFNLMVIRQSIYKSDVQLDEQCLRNAFTQFAELSRVMERLTMTPQSTAVEPQDLLDQLKGGGRHFSFNFYVENAKPEIWNALIEGLNQEIETLDLRGLRTPNEQSEMEVPYYRESGREVLKAGLKNFRKLTVLALDATPNMFRDELLAGPLSERLDALRLTAPAETNAAATGISPHHLNDCVRNYRHLTQLTADVCTDQANAQKEGRNVHEALKQLFLSIAESDTLQKVDLCTTAPVELPQKWLQQVERRCETTTCCASSNLYKP